jgi:hypothetical protein
MLVGLLTFLMLCSTVTLVVANGWGDPLATDLLGEDVDPGEEIHTVDARFSDGFADFRFVLDDSIYQANLYGIYIDLDKNSSTGDPMDMGSDVYLELEVTSLSNVYLYFGPNAPVSEYVYYNMTANNGTATGWSDPNIVPFFHCLTVTNSTQSEIVFGVNFTYVLQIMSAVGIEWDGSSVYLIFYAGGATDYCPNQGPGSEDYLEWILVDGGGIPGFNLLYLSIPILVAGGFYLRGRKKHPI